VLPRGREDRLLISRRQRQSAASSVVGDKRQDRTLLPVLLRQSLVLLHAMYCTTCVNLSCKVLLITDSLYSVSRSMSLEEADRPMLVTCKLNLFVR